MAVILHMGFAFLKQYYDPGTFEVVGKNFRFYETTLTVFGSFVCLKCPFVAFSS